MDKRYKSDMLEEAISRLIQYYVCNNQLTAKNIIKVLENQLSNLRDLEKQQEQRTNERRVVRIKNKLLKNK